MSIFGNIMGAIFGRGASASPAASGSAPPLAPSGTAPSAAVDVDAVLKERAAKKKESLDWRHSIVDLMKVLDLDSSLAARKELAKELNYTGPLDGSAEMNLWLHKQVVAKLAANGGKVSADLMH